MVFATDSEAGDRIMGHVYGSTATKTLPSMRARAQEAKVRREREARGLGEQGVLFDTGPQAMHPPSARYDHTPPWEPPPVLDSESPELDEPGPDPDDFDEQAWADDLDPDH